MVNKIVKDLEQYLRKRKDNEKIQICLRMKITIGGMEK